MIFEIAVNSAYCFKPRAKKSLSIISALERRKTERQSVIIDLDGVNSCQAFIGYVLPGDRFVSTGEPAAGLVFPCKTKVDEEIRPVSAAAGSLGGWLLGGKASTQKKCHILTISGNSLLLCLLNILPGERCVKIGEPAANVLLLFQSRVFDRVLKRYDAAGSLFFATDLHKTNTGGHYEQL